MGKKSKFSDQSSATDTEKALRVLQLLSNPNNTRYFFEDRTPRPELCGDVVATFNVFKEAGKHNAQQKEASNPNEQDSTEKHVYLVASVDESIKHHKPILVVASDPNSAIKRVQREVTSLTQNFRDYVLDLAVNCSFAENFYLSSQQEQDRFHDDMSIGTEMKLIESRIKTYFSDRPEFGIAYIQYSETENQSLITEEIFQFIAEKQKPEEHGLTAIDLEKMDQML